MNVTTRTNHRFDPFFDFTKLHDEMDRLFNGVSRSIGLRSVPRGTFPPVNVFESTEDILVSVEVPSIDPSALEISIAGDVLSIAGERRTLTNGDKYTLHRQERPFGRFHRSLSLPTGVNGNSCEATYENGILWIKLEKAKEAVPRKIEVKS